MHPLPAAQATAASLHALLPRHQPTSPDEQLVIDAITALRQWALPDSRPVSTRLRLRRSLPLRIRVTSSSSKTTLVTKRGKLRNSQTRRRRLSPKAELTPGPRTRLSGAGKSSSATDNVDEGTSQQRPLPNSDSQIVNSSDLSTEPPEGWPKLSDLSSPVLEHRTAVAESGKYIDKDGELPATPFVAEKRTEHGDLQTPVTNRKIIESGSKEASPRERSIATSLGKRVAKRRRVSPTIFDRIGGTEQVKPDSGATTASQGSTRGADSRAHSPSMKELVTENDDCAQHVIVHRKSANKRKSSVPKRRRPSTPDQTRGSAFITESEEDELGQTNSVVESPTHCFASKSPVHSRSDRNAESPPISVTQKSREQDADSHSEKSEGQPHSLGSIVVGSASYDGCSVDLGYDMTRTKRDDVPSRPSSVVWNESNVESIEEPPTGDQSGLQFDPIEETEKIPHSSLQESAEKSHRPDPLPNQDMSNTTPQVVKKGHTGDKSSFQNEIITSARLCKGSDKPVRLSDSKNSSITPSPSHPEKLEDPPNPKVPTPTASRHAVSEHDRTNPTRQLVSRISPVSLAKPPARSEKYVEDTRQQAKSSSPSETGIDEMVVCIASFTKEIESELAHELVMRLGGEIVSDFENAQPKCVVAPVDPQTKEVLSREMTILFALASRVPVVGLSWLARCFKSGCWVDFKDFETPSSRLKPSSGVFRGVAFTFEDAFSRKKTKKQCREYRDEINKLVELAGGVVTDKSKIVEAIQSDDTIRLHIQIAYDFGNDSLNTAPQQVFGSRVPKRVVNKRWISACLFSGQCPPP